MRVSIKVFSFCLVLFLALGLTVLSAQAQNASVNGGSFSAKGVITAPVPVSVFAPMGGQAGDFSWQPGDRAEAGGLAFDILPALVYAPADGVVAGLRAQAGDTAEGVMAQYGALCYINRDNIWHIEALITSTSDKEETRDVQVGQTLKIQHGTGDKKVRGEAAVIASDCKHKFPLFPPLARLCGVFYSLIKRGRRFSKKVTYEKPNRCSSCRPGRMPPAAWETMCASLPIVTISPPRSR